VHKLASITAHNLAKNSQRGTDKLSLVAQVPKIGGRGISVEPPRDRPNIVNTVVKPFAANSELDRLRATQILDFIISKKKKSELNKDILQEQKVQKE